MGRFHASILPAIWLFSFAVSALPVPDFYHTTDKIYSEVADIVNKCRFEASVESHPLDHDTNLQLVTISRTPESTSSETKGKTPLRAFFLFGEHAQELISTEVGLHFLRVLCGIEDSTTQIPSSSKGIELPEAFEIKIVPNANPIARKRVERGERCIRANENGVDLFRNWSIGLPQPPSAKGYIGGAEPFSEAETKWFKKQLDAFEPDLFVSVHSGDCVNVLPRASKKFRTADIDSLEAFKDLMILDDSNAVGSGGAPLAPKVKFDFSRTSSAYSQFVLETPVSMVIGVYGPKPTNIETRSKAFLTRRISAAQVAEPTPEDNRYDFEDNNNRCLEFFNPMTKSDYESILDQWGNGLVELLNVEKLLIERDIRFNFQEFVKNVSKLARRAASRRGGQ